jgi:hypothetical protein
MAKIPKNLQDIFNAKEEYLNSQRMNLEKNVISMQEKLLNKVIADIVSEMDTENGQIKQTTKNMRLISQLEQTYEQFNATTQIPVIKEFGKGLIGIGSYQKNYFDTLLSDSSIKKRFTSVVNNTDEFMKARIGVGAKNEIVEGGFLDSFIQDRTLVNDLKQITMRSVTGQMPIDEYKTLLKYKVVGNDQVDGKFQQYYKQFAYDQYNEYDRAYANTIAIEFKLDYAIYQGGLIDESRDFCRDHNGFVYTRDEISKFGQWTYAKAEHITFFNDSGDRVGVPDYIKKNPMYNPFISLGSYNCRHSLTFIDKITAIRLRPELKEITQ